MPSTAIASMSQRRRFGLLAACLLTATAAMAATATAAGSPAHAAALTRRVPGRHVGLDGLDVGAAAPGRLAVAAGHAVAGL